MIKRLCLPLFFVLALLSFTKVSGQSSTVYFYRTKNLIMANAGCMLIVNDTAKISLENGSFHMMKTFADSIDIVTSLKNNGIKSLKLDKGKTYYIEVDIKSPATLELVQRNEYMGKPAIDRLQADKLAEKNTADLESVKVESVATMPLADEGMAKIYLFRPFNVLGLSNITKVSDGEFVYEMKNNTSYVIETERDNITFLTLQETSAASNSSLNLKPEKGKVYYVAVLRSGGAIVLSETKEEYAKKEMKQ